MAIARWTIVGMLVFASGAAAHAAPALDSEADKRSYALGMAVGKQLRSQGLEVSPELYHQGLKDALSGGKTLLTEAEARAAVQRMQSDVNEAKRARQREQAAAAAAAASGLQVSFKIDQRLTKGLYMGDRWVSGATFSSGLVPQGEAIIVEARARGAHPRDAGPTWTTSDAAMVSISPSEGGDVKLTVHHAGESTVTIAYGGKSSTYTVKTFHEADRWRAELSKIGQAAPSTHITAAAAVPAGGRDEK